MLHESPTDCASLQYTKVEYCNSSTLTNLFSQVWQKFDKKSPALLKAFKVNFLPTCCRGIFHLPNKGTQHTFNVSNYIGTAFKCSLLWKKSQIRLVCNLYVGHWYKVDHHHHHHHHRHNYNLCTFLTPRAILQSATAFNPWALLTRQEVV